MSHLIDIFLQPGKAFAGLKERSSFLLPLALSLVLSGAMTFLYFKNVDYDWYLGHLFSSKPDMTAKEIAMAKTTMPGAGIMSWLSLVGVLVGGVLLTLVAAVYYLLAGKVTGNAVSFRHGLALSTWPQMPALLGVIVALVGVLTMTPQTPLESLTLLNVDPLLLQLPMDDRWSSLAKGFSLLTPWTWGLTALGWKTWGRTGWGQAVTVALLPWTVVYAGMIAWALAQ